MRDITGELKTLRLHGMHDAWEDLVEQGTLASLECWTALKLGDGFHVPA